MCDVLCSTSEIFHQSSMSARKIPMQEPDIVLTLYHVSIGVFLMEMADSCNWNIPFSMRVYCIRQNMLCASHNIMCKFPKLKTYYRRYDDNISFQTCQFFIITLIF